MRTVHSLIGGAAIILAAAACSVKEEMPSPEGVQPLSQAYALYVTDGVVTVAPIYRWYGYNVRPMLIENN